MAEPRKLIVSCAVTGSIHTPSMSPHLPITPEQIAEDAIGAARAGASILHLHARDPADGRPSADPALFERFLPRIAAETDAVVNITTGGGQGMTLDQRLAAARAAKPELCSLNMGTINFGIFPLAERPREWKHPWEQEYLRGTRDGVFRNTFADIESILRSLREEAGTRFEYECYDVGHLHTLDHFVRQGLAEPPLFIQTVFGILGGIAAEVDHLLHMRRTADRLFGGDYQWSVVAAGRNQMAFGAMAALFGGHVRVGLEDSLYAGPGRLARSSAEQVVRMRDLAERMELAIATPADVRAMLDLKGADAVAF